MVGIAEMSVQSERLDMVPHETMIVKYLITLRHPFRLLLYIHDLENLYQNSLRGVFSCLKHGTIKRRVTVT